MSDAEERKFDNMGKLKSDQFSPRSKQIPSHLTSQPLPIYTPTLLILIRCVAHFPTPYTLSFCYRGFISKHLENNIYGREEQTTPSPNNINNSVDSKKLKL